MFRKHFNATTIIAIVALVFAMTGGAYAAKKYLITNTKQISPKVLKQLKGANGPAGLAGAQGGAGPQGPAGTPGKDGVAGKDGANGKDGTDGKSVAVGTPSGGECPTGGATVELAGTPASKKKICNGEEGPQGNKGEPWTAGGTLPHNATETGMVNFLGDNADYTLGAVTTAASFSIPLSAPLDGGHVHIFGEANFASTCSGSYAGPTAPSGNLCIYGSVFGMSPTVLDPTTESPGAASPGFELELQFTEEIGVVNASWAVTG